MYADSRRGTAVPLARYRQLQKHATAGAVVTRKAVKTAVEPRSVKGTQNALPTLYAAGYHTHRTGPCVVDDAAIFFAPRQIEVSPNQNRLVLQTYLLCQLLYRLLLRGNRTEAAQWAPSRPSSTGSSRAKC